MHTQESKPSLSFCLVMTAMLVVVLNLSVVVPITPGNIGITQAVSVFLLDTFGVIPASALAYSIGAQGAMQLLLISLGMICLYREGMKPQRFSPEARGDSRCAHLAIGGSLMERAQWEGAGNPVIGQVEV